MFEELVHVCLFQSVGVESNALCLWIRLRGSNQSENLHHKMKSDMGYCNIGANIDHYIFVLLSYQHAVSTGIKICGDTNFVHPDFHIIERIKIRIQQIYDVLMCENQLNLSLPNFV